MHRLLESVREHPLDDAPRLVLADWRLEQDDPLGALVHLERSGTDPHRVRIGYAGLLRRLLGDLLGHVQPRAFRLGFLSEALDLGTAPLDSPLWDTVERLQTERSDLVVALARRALRSVHLDGWAPFARLLAHREPTPLQRVWPLDLGREASPERALAELPAGPGALAELTELALISNDGAPWLHTLADALLALPLPLRLLRVETCAPPSEAQRARYAAHPTLERVEWHEGSWDRSTPRWAATLPPIRFGVRPVAQPTSSHTGAFAVLGLLDVLCPDLWLAADGSDRPVLISPPPPAHGPLPTRLDAPPERVHPAGAPLGTAPWNPDTVSAVLSLCERTAALLPPGGELSSESLSRVVRLGDGSLALLGDASPWPEGGLAEIRRQLACHVPGRHPWAGATARGPVRAYNEDTFGVHPEGVWVVADGMGGSSSGAPTAQLVTAVLCGPSDVHARFREACARISELGIHSQGSGATVVRLEIEGDRAHLSWLGDCRAYLLREGRIAKLTRDHTLVEEMIRRGQLQPWEARRHPHGNIITRAVFSGPEPQEPETASVKLIPGDRILLASDGMWRALDDQTILALILASRTLHDAVHSLITEADRTSGIDNITALIVRYDG